MSDIEYDFSNIEKKWQKKWEDDKLFLADENSSKKKYYLLNMFPYPSGVLHMGHVINYTIGDVLVRYKLLQGYNLLSPMGWDSFGLPAENAAIRTGIHPQEFTEKNIFEMRKQMKRAGWGYDWTREFATSHPDYYKWTQWLFLKFFNNGLAVKKTAPVNWCDSCNTVLANEQVKEGSCERCGTSVEQKDMSQWFYKMSQYAERLLSGLEKLRGNWPDAVLSMQEEWIGKSTGAEIEFKVKETGDTISVFTTRPDTLWGVTFISLAPEHPLIAKLIKNTPEEKNIQQIINKLRQSGTSEKELAEKEKEGVFTGFHVINPVNNLEVPLWVANFALMTYGTGAVMSVPAHDQRDWEFAKKYDIPIVKVIEPKDKSNPEDWQKAYVDKGEIVNSGIFTGEKDNFAAIPKIVSWLEKEGKGKKQINYRLRDWLLSRQRYWGAPIPIVYCDDCGIVPVPEEDLPVLLPMDVDFAHGSGNPLLKSSSFINCKCPVCNKSAKRETDTMDTFVDSSWYELRFADPKNSQNLWDKQKINKWLPVDQYIGGIEHATMHLIYVRFFAMALHDLGLIDFEEPISRLFCQGMVCKVAYRCPHCKWIAAKDVIIKTLDNQDVDVNTQQDLLKKIDSQNFTKSDLEKSGYKAICKICGVEINFEMAKISKSKLNIVDPDYMMDKYGADTVRLYMLSDTPPDRMQIWSEDGINGSWRTINRLWLLIMDSLSKIEGNDSTIPAELDDINIALRRKTHQCIQKVTESIEGGYQFNTAIARCNELLHTLRSSKDKVLPAVLRETIEVIVKILSPIIPHFSEECWQRLGHTESIFKTNWPDADPNIAKEESIELPIQINGKVRAKIVVSADMSNDEVENLVLNNIKVKQHIGDKEIVKIIVIPNRMVNIALK